MQLLLRWIVSAIALYITVLIGAALNRHDPRLHLQFYVAPGTAGAAGLLVTVLALGIVNAVLRPLVKLLTLPASCLTFGLFAFVINALMFWIAGQVIPEDFHVAGWQAPLFGSIVMSLVSGALNSLVSSQRERQKRREKAR